MNTNANQIDQTIEELKKHRVAFAHSPLMWSQYSLAEGLKWESVKFGEEERTHVPLDRSGVYAFMLEPDFVGPPKSAYLMYIGKTTDPLRERYGRYLTRELNRKFGRTIIGRMLNRWFDHLRFYYAPIGDKDSITGIEETLLSACVPPYNQTFTGKAGPAIMAFKSEIAAGG